MENQPSSEAFRPSRRGFLQLAAGVSALPGLAQEAAVPPVSDGPPLKLGLIGAGGRGSWIAKLFRDAGGFQFVSVADYFRSVAEASGVELGVPKEKCHGGLSGFRRVIESGVEAVVLQTPPYFFPEHAMAAAEAGLHVYMAKPVAVDVPGVMRIQEAAKVAAAKSRVFLIDYQMPRLQANIEAWRLVRDGNLGPIRFLDSHYFAGTFADPPKTATAEDRLQRLVWVNDIALGGGYHVNACVHAVQAALWLAGALPERANADSLVGRPDAHGDSHDVFAIRYSFSDGMIWTHRGKHLNNETGFDVAAEAHGPDGFARLAYNGETVLKSKTQRLRSATETLYEAGAKASIARFRELVRTGVFTNESVAWAIDSALVAILGREAGRRGRELSMEYLLKENLRVEADLKGLKD